MANSHLVQQHPTLRGFTIDAECEGRPAYTMIGTAYDFGDGANSHSVIYEAVHDHINGITHTGGMGHISGLQFEPAPLPKGRGRPQKMKRDVALALAHVWFTVFFQTQSKLSPSAAKGRAYGAVIDMWQESFWQGAADESALRKNIKKGMQELHGLRELTYIAPDPSKSIVIAGQEQDFDLQPHKSMKFKGTCWMWKFGQQHARYGSASIPETPLFQD